MGLDASLVLGSSQCRVVVLVLMLRALSSQCVCCCQSHKRGLDPNYSNAMNLQLAHAFVT